MARTFQFLFLRVVPYPISCLIFIQTSSVLPVFVLAMALYPAVQQRAQEEIDSVIGKDRFPTFQDRNKLPYVQAIVREVLRWRPIGPIGECKLFPTLSGLNTGFRFSEMLSSGAPYAFCCLIETENLQDDLYKGYLIQAGTQMSFWKNCTIPCSESRFYRCAEYMVRGPSVSCQQSSIYVLPLVRAMNRDPHLYRDCDKFYPERFLDFQGDVPGALGQGHVSYVYSQSSTFYTVLTAIA